MKWVQGLSSQNRNGTQPTDQETVVISALMRGDSHVITNIYHNLSLGQNVSKQELHYTVKINSTLTNSH
ncbi:hypothetical protein F8388_014392 [Cannabis sativa]|uniref:Uncharacterized protein n=1 Tax=Cannabis sativa TaxID=3483 RepID=A0A7J6G0U1_CANSA|nr:hypothetical protein F8388_014392 [Cannabis sativa]